MRGASGRRGMGVIVEVYEILVRRLRRGYDQWSHPLPYLQKEGRKGIEES